jgi:CheY-like chemotaxis protein
MKGSIGLRPVWVSLDGVGEDNMLSAYRLTLRFPVELQSPLQRARMQSVQTQATNTITQTSVSMHTQRVLPELPSRDTNAGPLTAPSDSTPEMFTTTVIVQPELVGGATELSPSSLSAPPDPASTTTDSATRSTSPLLTPQISPVIGDAGNHSTPVPEAAPAPSPRTPSHVPFQCAVIVDDEAANRKIAERMFQRLRRAAATAGTTASEVVSPTLDIICLTDGTELLNVLTAMQSRQIPCLVLLDIWMPHSDGVSVCKSVRDNGLTHAVIAMTAHVEAGSIRKYRETGFNGVLSKPFSSEQLTNTLLLLAQLDVPAWIEPA